MSTEFTPDDLIMAVREGEFQIGSVGSVSASSSTIVANIESLSVAVISLSTNDGGETEARAEGDTSLSTRIDDVTIALGDTTLSLSTVISQEVTTGLSSAVSLVISLSTQTTDDVTQLQTDFQERVQSAALSLSSLIANGGENNDAAIQSLSTALAENDEQDDSAVLSLSTNLSAQVDSLSTLVGTGGDGVRSLSTKVDGNESTTTSSVTSLSALISAGGAGVASLSTVVSTNAASVNSGFASLSTLVGTGGSGLTSLSTKLEAANQTQDSAVQSAVSSVVTLVGAGGSGLSSLSTLNAAQVTSLSTKIATTPGPRGEKGDKGDTGDTGRAIVLLGGLDDPDDLPTAEESELGDAYLIEKHFWVFMETGWKDMGTIEGPDGLSAYDLALKAGYTGSEQQWLISLKGADGIGLRILGSFPSLAALPQVNNTNGDAYIIQTQMWVWTGVVTGWQPVGQVGPTGKSALDIAIQQGNVPVGTTLAQFYETIRGKNAYELVIQEGYIGTIRQWLDSLVGPQGNQGDKGDQGDIGPRGLPAAAIKVLGQVDTFQELPQADNTTGDAYFVLLDLWVWTGTQYQNLGPIKGEKGDTGDRGLKGIQGDRGDKGDRGITGASLYDVAVAAGYNGDVAAWLLTMKGPPGTAGSDGLQGLRGDIGPQGTGLFPRGSLPSADFLPALSPDNKGWVYTMADTKHMWISSGASWVDHGDMRGSQGDKGDKGDTGDQGPPGPPIQANGSVQSLSDLPSDAADFDAYVVLDNGHFYMRLTGQWRDLGPFQGPKGDKGDKGNTGDQGVIGPMGQALVPKGSLANAAALPAAAIGNLGWLYTTLDNKHMVASNGTVWIDFGDISGIQGLKGDKGNTGDKGDTGAGLKLLGNKANAAALPATGNSLGDAWMLLDTNHMWIWNGLQWVDAGAQRGATGQSAYEAAVQGGFTGSLLAWVASLKGDKGDKGDTGVGTKGDKGDTGDKGDQGDQGPVGPGLTILGKKNSTAELPATGALGSGYIIGLNFWVWTGAAFEDMGTVQGPKGDRGLQGIKGDTGLKGDKGIQGDQGVRGTVWIALARAPGPADGSVNDYFINTIDNTYYYKVGATNWQFLGNLGAGNVYDAPLDDIKYVRLNGAWTALVFPTIPVLEAPLDNGYYTRRNGAWVAIQFPASDGNYYVYRNGAWVVKPVNDAFNSYTVKSGAVTTVLDLAAQQAFNVDATVNRTLTFANAPAAGRAMVVPVFVTGSAGVITWPSGITWDGNLQPVLGGSFTNVILSWSGLAWSGIVGAKN